LSRRCLLANKQNNYEEDSESDSDLKVEICPQVPKKFVDHPAENNAEEEVSLIQNETFLEESYEDESRPTLIDPFSPTKEIPREDGYFTFQATQVKENIPKSYDEAMSNEFKNLWEPAIKEELESIFKNETWKCVKKSCSVKELPYKWVSV